MMESCLAGKPERVGPVEVVDIRKDLLSEFSAFPGQESFPLQSENLQVYLRIRPFTAAERDNAETLDCVGIEGPDTVVLRAPRSCQPTRQSEKSLPQTAQKFSFTQVFGPEASQRTVFKGSVRGLVQDVLEGGNCLVFTYGVTNGGKTFTFLGPEHNSGLLPRSLSVIFNSIEGRLYSHADLKPQRCRDFNRLTPDQQVAESKNKKNLMRLLKEARERTGSSLSSDTSMNSVSEPDSFCLNVNSNVRFSVWVSFCEIYNDNIHDLLEQVPSGHHKRTVLRLSQDVKGNSFIKDLRWVQVNSSEEAYRVMKIGKKNQSFSSTRLNQLSSRSHSIFSIRILRVDDVGVPRVLSVSELALCDLAGSERCSRTHNTGERLREAGNINNSLLTLGKCMNAMRLNQHAKIHHHVPFRESKLTHFLQFFFCGAGRVSMVVNINQSTSCFDETVNVLKFSALAQKVVVLNPRPVLVDDACQSSAMDLSVIIDGADQRRNVSGRGRKSSLVAWETTLEDVLEDEEEDYEEEDSAMEGTVLEKGGEDDLEEEGDTTMEEEKADGQAALRLVLEAQIREEVSAEFMELFNKMEKDYSDRLEKEREILEERADRRVEILKNLVSKTADLSAVNSSDKKEEQAAILEDFIISMTEDLEKIKENARSVQHCLTEHAVAAELEALRLEKQQSHDKLCEAQQSLEHERQKFSELMQICQQKDDMINKLQATMGSAVEDANRNKRQHDALQDKEKTGQPAKKRVVLEEEIWRLHEENDKKEETIQQLTERTRGLEVERSKLKEELRRQEEYVEKLKKEQVLLELKVQNLTDLDHCLNCDSVFSTLELEQRETSRLTKENKALVNGMFHLQTELTDLQKQLKEQTDGSDNLSEQLSSAKTHLLDLESQLEETKTTDNLKQELKEQQSSNSSFHAAIEELKNEKEAVLQRLSQKSQQIQDLHTERSRPQETLTHSETRCSQLMELSNQKAEFSHQLQSLRAEMEETRREKQELEHLKEDLQRRKENWVEKVSVVEELKGEIQRHERRRRRKEQQEGGSSTEMESVGETEEKEDSTQSHAACVHAEERVPMSPLKSNMARSKKTHKTTCRKRKSWEMEDLVFNENKRNKVRGNTQKRSSSAVKEKQNRTLEKIQELIHNSPSILNSKAENSGLVSGHPVEKETVSIATKSRQGRKILYRLDASSVMLDSPHMMSEGAQEEKESDHFIITRQLRSKTCRK